MKNLFYILSIIVFTNTSCYALDSKIKPITGIILLCSGEISTYECNDALLSQSILKSPIKFVNRVNLKNILDEHKLHSSGLTDDSKKIGKLIGASHLLLYKQEFSGAGLSDKPGRILSVYKFKLINIETSEEEFVDSAFEFSDVGKQGVPKSLLEDNIENFFEILNLHSRH